MRVPKLDVTRTARVRGASVTIGLATFTVRDALAMATARGGPSLEVVLVGDMTVRAEPPDSIEAHQMDRFTGARKLDTAIRSLVLASGDASFLSDLIASETADAPEKALAEAAFTAWRDSPERRIAGTAESLTLASLGDEVRAGFRAAYAVSPVLGAILVFQDPRDPEPFQIGCFRPLELGAEERERARKDLKKLQREGKLSSWRVEDLGDWNVLTSTVLPGADGKPAPGSPGFQIDKQTIQVALEKDGEHLHGTSRIDLHVTSPGRMGLGFTLAEDLRVESVRDQDGRSLSSARDHESLLVFLPEKTREAERRTIEIRYGGPALETFDRGVQILRYTKDWYPGGGDVDRAVFDVTLRWPKRFDLLASGKVTESGEEAGTRWERRTLDVPSLAFSFQVGSFDVRREQAGHVALTVGFAKWPSGVDAKMQDSVLATLKDALLAYEKLFGPYPLDYLTVATVPGSASQGFLGFITYSHFLVARDGDKALFNNPYYYTGGRLGRGERLEILVHELAHQWWGNKIGWDSYRDQWLSEALADYVAKQFTYYRLGQDEGYLRTARAEQRRALAADSGNGRTAISAGPVSIGQRLRSFGDDDPYQAIVYSKGALVFDMLARELGEEAFLGMLRTLADKVGNRVIRTSTFFKALERMSGKDLAPFVREFVDGVGMPQVEYRVRSEKTGEKEWTFQGEARQSPSGRRRWSAVRVGDRGWDVAGAFVPEAVLDVRSLQVDYRIFTDEMEEEPSASGEDRPKIPEDLHGTVALGLSGEPFEVRALHEPRRFVLNARGDVLADFFEVGDTREKLADTADRALIRGETAEAETLYRRALEAALDPPRKGRWAPSDPVAHAVLLDARIHLGLCRAYLDLGRDDAAATSLEAAEKTLRGPQNDAMPKERAILFSRLALRRGDPAAAYKKLDDMWLPILQREGETMAEQARRVKYASGWEGTGEAYGLLALGGHAAGPEEVCRIAREQARRRGVDTTALDALHEP